MAINDIIKEKLNRMCRAANDASIGTFVQLAQSDIATAQTDIATLQGKAVYGVYTVTAADVTATNSTINTSKTIAGQIVSVMRASLQLPSAKVTFATTNLKIETNGTAYVLTAGDIINYIIW